MVAFCATPPLVLVTVHVPVNPVVAGVNEPPVMTLPRIAEVHHSALAAFM